MVRPLVLALLLGTACGEAHHRMPELPAEEVTQRSTPVPPTMPVRLCLHLRMQPEDTLVQRTKALMLDLTRHGVADVSRNQWGMVVLRAPASEVERLFSVRLRYLGDEQVVSPDTPPVLPDDVAYTHGGLSWGARP